MSEFLLELYSEEIPPQLQINARTQLKQLIEKSFEEKGISEKIEKSEAAKKYDAGEISLEEFKASKEKIGKYTELHPDSSIGLFHTKDNGTVADLFKELEAQRKTIANNQIDTASKINDARNEFFDRVEAPLPVFTDEEQNFIVNHFNPFVGKTIAFNKDITRALKIPSAIQCSI